MVDIDKLVTTVLENLTFPEANISVTENKDQVGIIIEVDEEYSGMLIGYRGEKINALQLLFTLMINNESIAYRPLHLDINGYRERRHKSLFEMADSAAVNATESGREILLPPLPSYERRAIHLHLESNDKVKTYSEGEGDQRRLVIRPKSD